MQLQISRMLQEGTFDRIGAVAELKRSPYFSLLTEAYEKLRTGLLYRSKYHGTDHIERVMLLGAVIAQQQNFSLREAELLLIGCSYHDIGRIDDSKDDRHGKRSADAIASIPGLELSPEELKCIQAAVATHSTKDTRIDSFAGEYGVPDEYMDLCRRLCRGLKDADNLDRVRIGDLDIRHLRFAESRRMKPLAEEIYQLGKGRGK